MKKQAELPPGTYRTSIRSMKATVGADGITELEITLRLDTIFPLPDLHIKHSLPTNSIIKGEN